MLAEITDPILIGIFGTVGTALVLGAFTMATTNWLAMRDLRRFVLPHYVPDPTKGATLPETVREIRTEQENMKADAERHAEEDAKQFANLWRAVRGTARPTPSR